MLDLSSPLVLQGLDACPVALFVNRLEDPEDDSSLLIVFANRAACEQTGVPAAAMIGRRCIDVFPSVREGGFLDILFRVLRTGQAEDYENNVYEDERLAAAFAGHVERIGEDLAFNWCENVTLRKQAEAKAARAIVLHREAEERAALLCELERANQKANDALDTYELIADAAQEALWEITLATPDEPLIANTACRFSDRYAQLVGLSPGEIEPVAGALYEFIHPDDLERVRRTLRQTLEDPAARFQAEYRLVTRTGATLVVAAAASARRDEEGRVRKLAGALRDVTLERQAEAELRERLALIERQQGLIEALSTPLLEVWDGVLALPIVGALDARRATIAMNELLQAVADKGIRFALVDLTGVDVMDTATAEHVVRIARAVELLGAQAFITGIQPAVARTIVVLGIDLSTLATRRNLRDALRECQVSLGRERRSRRLRDGTNGVSR
jgi:anti-anti-sigma factor